ncbi:MAG: metallophosphoesterase [Vicinamibacterales bacterium]
MSLTRRDVLKTLGTAGVGIVTGVAAHGIAYGRHQLITTEAAVPVSGLPPALDGLRVGLITDIHHSGMVSAGDVTQAVERLRGTRPDLIVLGGDYVTYGDRRYVGPVAERLAPLAGAPHGSFAVLGNHDDDRDMASALAERGFMVLKDQRTTLTIKGERLDLAGIRFWTRRPHEIATVLRGTGETTVLLAHDPRRLVEAARLDVQVVLSGHTHGGQVLLPGVGAVVGRKFPVLSGLASSGSTSLFVSRGVGTVYAPVRINCPPEVAVLTLRSSSSGL